MTHMVAGKMDLRSMVETTIDAVSDKSTVARDKAQLLLVEVFKSEGRDVVQAGCRGMVLAKMGTVNPMISRATATAFGGGDVEVKPTKPPAAAMSSSSSYSSRVKNVSVLGGRTLAPSPKENLCPSGSKPIPPKQRYMSLEQPAQEPAVSSTSDAPPPSMYKTLRLKQPAAPLKSQTTTSIPSTSSAFPRSAS
ncbi:hypothetical protein DYB28_006154 [Aphanomyces astaci]|uniref:Uncharacterized protein n=2 Tax=Aphanomyces astaci TaxID=112090 RepID=A0A397EVA8_APHAT|nr:hypothetical protein DYB30_010306 [Aphanomyces astaci]RHY82011.1 hypothetical protein DYB26_013409 [Aphanomyces astaci]RHZ00242.1 hypothetical protein DYB31_014235 [Aphanomyces astaci]RLO00040.1 hypothetical protein DYB28_006154 [Aphanomyces astaci]